MAFHPANQAILTKKVFIMIDAVKTWAAKAYRAYDPLFMVQMPFYVPSSKSLLKADLALLEQKLVGLHFVPLVSKPLMDDWLKKQSGYLEVFDDVWLCIPPPMLTNAIAIVDTSVGLLVIDKTGRVVKARAPNGEITIERTAIIEIFNQEVDHPADPKLKTSTKNNLMQRHIRQAFAFKGHPKPF